MNVDRLERTGRRGGLRAAIVGAVVTLLLGCSAEREVSGDAALRVGFVGLEEGGESARLGAELGAEEARHAGDLVGRGFELLLEEADSPDEAVDVVERLAERGVSAVIGGFDAPTCQALSEAADRLRILFLNVGCREDALRTDRRRSTLHVEASQAMYEAGLGRFGREAVLWHGELERFGAAQLNERFNRRFGAPADARGWASWLAVKIVWETFSAAGVAEPDSLLAVLTAPETRFDGHKGEPLTFDHRTHQLQQPLFARPLSGQSREQGSEALARHEALPLPSSVELGPGPFLYVSNEGSVDVSVVDLERGETVARLPVARRPRGIHLDPSGEHLYVALSDDSPRSESDKDGVAVFDLRHGGEQRSYAVGSDPEQFVISPDGERLYAANEDAGTATATELATGRVLATVVVGIEPEGVAVSPDGRWIYVTAETSNTISVIDTRSNEVVASFLVGVRPRAAVFSPGADRAYVTNEISGSVSVVAVADHAVIGTVPLPEGSRPVGIAVAPDGRRVYVATGHHNSVAVVDPASNEVIADVQVGKRPWGITLSPDGRFAYTANGVSNDVTEIDTKTLRVTRTIPVGARPWGVAFAPAR